MTGRVIRQLPRAVVDRIAAGEVIERPASVVKELVENALDAHATDIHVSIEEGGLRLIRVADDGGGIGEQDLGLLFEAHATSKLTDVEDLQHIISFGFRGEALASIAAVSRTRIRSRTPESEAAWSIESSGGETTARAPSASSPGTVVEVRDLFFNTPARRGFLGAISTESARCRDVCGVLALANPGVRFAFETEGKLRLAVTPVDGLHDRIAAVYGDDFATDLIPVHGQAEGIAVEGWLSRPAVARPRAKLQQLFVNDRPVRDRSVVAAVRSACQDFLPGSLQPSWVLALRVDPAAVDVNVHPTKAEVRFRDRDTTFRTIRAACRRALLDADLAPRVRAEHVWGARQAMPAAGPGSAVAEGMVSAPSPVAPAQQAGFDTRDVPGQGAPLPSLESLRPVGRYLQVLDTYIAHDSPDGLVLVDQHALHERILYARLQNALTEGRVESQRLLLPETVQVPPRMHERALRIAEELARLGLVVEAFGPDTLAIHAIPAVLRQENLSDLLIALVEPPELHGGIPSGLDRRLFTIACHAAVKAGDTLDEREIEDLLRQGAELEHDATCPHGRPTRLVVGRDEFERLFKRSGF
jgi:DNA mismatch repair protein MutL